VTGGGIPVCVSAEIAVQVVDICTSDGGTPLTPFCGETCLFQFDLECDAGTFCASDSDIFDCDSFQQFRLSGCEGCVANGGSYCETGNGVPVCSSPDIAQSLPEACSILGAVSGGQFAGTPYMSSCGGTAEPGSPEPRSPEPGSPVPGTPEPAPTASPGVDRVGGSSGGLAALSVLALIPIAGMGYFICRHHKKSAGLGSPGKRDNNAPEVTTSNNPDNQVNQSEDRQPWLSSRNNAPRVPQPPAQQSGHGGGYLPRNKDQAQSVLHPQAQSVSVTASLASGSASATRARQDPPSDPPATAVSSAHAVPADEGPDVKDQCREVIADRQSSGPPLAHAIVIDPSDVEGIKKSD